MRFRFSPSAILRTTTVIAVTLGGVFAVSRTHPNATGFDLAIGFILTASPFWVPLVFLAYAVGRNTVTNGTVVAFVFAEAIAVGAMLIVRTFR